MAVLTQSKDIEMTLPKQKPQNQSGPKCDSHSDGPSNLRPLSNRPNGAKALIQVGRLIGTGLVKGLIIQNGQLHFSRSTTYRREVSLKLNPKEPAEYRYNRLLKRLTQADGEEACIIFQDGKPQKLVLTGCVSNLASPFPQMGRLEELLS